LSRIILKKRGTGLKRKSKKPLTCPHVSELKEFIKKKFGLSKKEMR